jgi:DNA-binding CsgD family transcriptional regulator
VTNATTQLLEREVFLDALADYAQDAASGNGRLVVVTGEAGIGKTTLIDAFRASRSDMRWLWGACDGGFTPRPLGPLYDMASTAGGRLHALRAGDTDRNELFAAFLDLLAEGTPGKGPTGVVVEDLHWADEATLDWLTHVSRRLSGLPALVVATCRDDEPGEDALLADVMGRLAGHASTRRVTLPRLTPEAVGALAEGQQIEGLHELTGGNPFYVAEVLAMGADRVPPSVADIVRARSRRHSPAAQRILAAAAVLGRPAPASLLAAVSGVAAAAVDECVTSGTLVAAGHDFGFRHELTRRAVEEAIPHVQATELHRIALLALEREGADEAELTHHAVGAGDPDSIVRHAPLAGRVAAAASAHREAVVQFRRALEYADRMTPQERADIEEATAESLSTRDQWAEAEPHWRRSIAIRRTLDEPADLARCLRRYGICLWRLCRTAEFRAAQDEAFELMREADDGPERAIAFYNRAVNELTPLAERRLALDECTRIAKDLNDEALVGRSCMAKAFLQADVGILDFDALEESLDHGLRSGDTLLAAAAYTNMYECSIDMLRFKAAERYEEGLSYCLEHEQHTYSLCLRGSRVTELLRRGANQQAVDLALATLEEPTSPVNRMHLMLGLSQAAFRLGRQEAQGWLEETWELGLGNDQTGWLVKIATCAAEGSWLTGEPALIDERVHEAYRRGLTDDPWAHGELTAWLQRLGHEVDVERSLVPPYSLEVAGQYAEAAAAWRELGCPFEEAVALTWTGDPEAMRRALDIFTELQATPAAANVRRLLQQQGIHVPAQRGPRAATAAHPAGLTAREAEVLEVLREGLTNAEIAQRLYLSQRTVDHHVSAILAKMGVSSRTEAIEQAARL